MLEGIWNRCVSCHGCVLTRLGELLAQVFHPGFSVAVALGKLIIYAKGGYCFLGLFTAFRWPYFVVLPAPRVSAHVELERKELFDSIHHGLGLQETFTRNGNLLFFDQCRDLLEFFHFYRITGIIWDKFYREISYIRVVCQLGDKEDAKRELRTIKNLRCKASTERLNIVSNVI